MYKLYRIKRQESLKSYIGITKNSLSKRWAGHKYSALSGKKSPLYDSMRKYGIESFSITLLQEFDTWQDCCNAEKSLIKEEKNQLFNLAAGGEGGFVVSNTALWKEKLRKARAGKKPALGMKHTEENKIFFSECSKRRKLKYEGALPSTFKEASSLGISKTHYYRLRRAKSRDLG